MTRYRIEAAIDGEPAQIVNRHIESPELIDGVLYIDSLGVSVGKNAITNEGIVLRLRIGPPS